jgi:hypothetical protein
MAVISLGKAMHETQKADPVVVVIEQLMQYSRRP